MRLNSFLRAAMTGSKPFCVTFTSFLSPLESSSILTRPSLGVKFRAVSIIMVHCVEAFPFAGVTVIHGSWVFAIQASGESRLTQTSPPSAPISMASVSSLNSGTGSTQAEAANSSAVNAYIYVLFIFNPVLYTRSYVFPATCRRSGNIPCSRRRRKCRWRRK